MGKPTPEAEAAILAGIDWARIDAMTDADIARQIADDPDTAPDLADVPPQSVRVVHPPGGVSVRGIRAKLNMTQQEFAQRFGFSLSAVRDWEQGRKQPEAGTRTLLLVIETHPDLVAQAAARSAA